LHKTGEQSECGDEHREEERTTLIRIARIIVPLMISEQPHRASVTASSLMMLNGSIRASAQIRLQVAAQSLSAMP
jgi:hypothetical protein